METTNHNYIVLMAGGSGTRLWPMSRKDRPKQFHRFIGENSLLQDTYNRVKDLVPVEHIFVSLGEDIVKETQKQLKAIPHDNYIIEPVARNTAPAIALCCAQIFKRDPLAIIATVSSDHTVEKIGGYQRVFREAFSFVQKRSQYLVTVGISPDRPETGYGYIKMGEKIGSNNIHQALEFREKPDLETAKKYLRSGKYVWNASYFFFSAGEMIKMYKNFVPEIYGMIKEILPVIKTRLEKKVINEVFNKLSSTPFDTAIAEKTQKIAVIPADLGWSDVGSWASLYDLLCPSEADTIVHRGHHVGVGDNNCLFFAQDKLLATVGLENIIVVDTPDATLVCNKEKAQEIKGLIEKLKTEGKHQYL